MLNDPKRELSQRDPARSVSFDRKRVSRGKSKISFPHRLHDFVRLEFASVLLELHRSSTPNPKQSVSTLNRGRMVLEFRWLSDEPMTLKELSLRFGLKGFSERARSVEFKMATLLYAQLNYLSRIDPSNENAREALSILEKSGIFSPFVLEQLRNRKSLLE